MIHMENFEKEDIVCELEDIRSECSDIEDEGIVTNIKCCCRRVENLLDSLREVDEDEDLRDMIPEDLSAGAAISLKETLNKWRSENGYHEL